MIKIPFSQNYQDNMDRHAVTYTLPCVICGKGAPNTPYHVIMWGGLHIVTKEESEAMGGANNSAYMGAYPIGQDCKRRHPELVAYIYKTEHAKCINHKRKNASWFFPYKSNNEDVRAYYCEECAREQDYTAFNQPMQKVEGWA